jgi:hypothetical protein
MKKILLVITLLTSLGVANLNAQINNGSFESWAPDTFYFAAGTYASLPADTTVFNNPLGWISSNFLTELDSVGPIILATQDYTTVMPGHTSSLKLTTDSLHPHLGLALPVSEIFLPGFVVNGTFSLSSITGAISGGSITPAAVKGAGEPCTVRLDSFKGYFNYAPLINTASHLHDTCVLWAVLRKGPITVANAIFKYGDSTAGFLPFSAPFTYVSCDMPDTLVILLASGPPNLTSFLPGGPKTIVAGSTLWVDSLYADTLAGNYIFPPFARNDISNATVLVPDTIDVLANDTDCEGVNHLSVSIVGNPNHGTATVITNGPYKNNIRYVSNVGYTGVDSIYYQDTNNQSNETSDALVVVFVLVPSGISQVNTIPVSVYPVPAANELNIQFENPGNSTAKIYDMLGNLVVSGPLMNDRNVLNLGNMANGFYCLSIENERNELLARSTFVVAK